MHVHMYAQHPGDGSPELTMTKGSMNWLASSIAMSSWDQLKGKGVSHRYLQGVGGSGRAGTTAKKVGLRVAC